MWLNTSIRYDISLFYVQKICRLAMWRIDVSASMSMQHSL